MSDHTDYDRPDRPDTAQPSPIHRPGAPSMHDLVIADAVRQEYPHVARLVESRKAFGLAKYGTPLQLDNGRDYLADALEEAGDLLCYLRGCAEQGIPRTKTAYDRLTAVTEGLSEIYYAREQGTITIDHTWRP